jgi:hypothetical protein
MKLYRSLLLTLVTFFAKLIAHKQALMFPFLPWPTGAALSTYHWQISRPPYYATPSRVYTRLATHGWLASHRCSPHSFYPNGRSHPNIMLKDNHPIRSRIQPLCTVPPCECDSDSPSAPKLLAEGLHNVRIGRTAASPANLITSSLSTSSWAGTGCWQ